MSNIELLFVFIHKLKIINKFFPQILIQMEENKKQKGQFATSLQYRINSDLIEGNLIEIAKKEGYKIKNLSKIFFSEDFILTSIQYLFQREKNQAQNNKHLNNALDSQLQLRRKFKKFDYFQQLSEKKKQGVSTQFLSNMLILSKLLSKLMKNNLDKMLIAPQVIFVVLVYTATYILPSPATFFIVHRNLQNRGNYLPITRSIHLKNGKNKTRHHEDQVEFLTFRKQLQNILKNQNHADEANRKNKQPKSTICIMRNNFNMKLYSCQSDSFTKQNPRLSSIVENKLIFSRPVRYFSEHTNQTKDWKKESLLKHDYLPFFKGKSQEKQIKKDSKNEIERIQVLKKRHIITQKFVFRRKESMLRL